jgi:hypothetical protein
MVAKTSKTKKSEQKRASKGWRTHIRRMKQESRKTSSDHNQPVRTSRPPAETK